MNSPIMSAMHVIALWNCMDRVRELSREGWDLLDDLEFEEVLANFPKHLPTDVSKRDYRVYMMLIEKVESLIRRNSSSPSEIIPRYIRGTY